MGEDGAVPEEPDPRVTARSTVSRWALGAVLAIGALALLLKPGAGGKVLGLVLAAAAVTTFVRRDRSSATIVVVVLVAVAGFFLVAALTGNADWVVERYTD